jgi:hypothetical protein
MHDPKRPWCTLTWIRIVDHYHTCLCIQQLADALFGPALKDRAWAKHLRQQLKTKSDGITRVLQSASVLWLKHGLWGTPKVYNQVYANLKNGRLSWTCGYSGCMVSGIVSISDTWRGNRYPSPTQVRPEALSVSNR